MIQLIIIQDCVLLFLVQKKKKLELIFEIEEKMRELGIIFDSGYGRGCRDWEFDWSLQGKHFIFDEKEQKYKEIKRGSKKVSLEKETLGRED